MNAFLGLVFWEIEHIVFCTEKYFLLNLNEIKLIVEK